MRDQPSKTMRVQAGHESEASQAKQAKPSQDKTSRPSQARLGSGCRVPGLLLAGFRAAWRWGFLARKRAARPPATQAGRRAGRQEGGGKAGGGREGRRVGRRAGRRRKTEDVFLFPEDGRRKSYAFRLPVLRLPSSGIRSPSSALRLPGIRKTSSAVPLACEGGNRTSSIFRAKVRKTEDGSAPGIRHPDRTERAT